MNILNRSDPQPRQQSQSAPLVIYPHGAAQVEAERQRLGITPEKLEEMRRASTKRPF